MRNLKRCTSCYGGTWEAECCDGSRGCSCKGQPVFMGTCNVCYGKGFCEPDADPLANANSINSCYLGSGPRW